MSPSASSDSWSTGKKMGEDVPVERGDEDGTSIMPTGACGAFVTGLEDEFMSVRNASVSAVTSLAEAHPEFASKALDFLTDMFNDEIQEVRLNSILCLNRLCKLFQLREEQTEVILGVLDEGDFDNREALRDLLSRCSLFSCNCVVSVIKTLLNNLRRYPSDKPSIWRCMKQLGTNNATLIQSLVPDLLDLHPFIDNPEPSIDDDRYMCVLILVLNAASRVPTIKSLFVDHVWRHYEYLRHCRESLVPPLEQTKVAMTVSTQESAARTKMKDLLTMIGRKLRAAQQVDPQKRSSVLKMLLSDLCKSSEFFTADASAHLAALRILLGAEHELEMVTGDTSTVTTAARTGRLRESLRRLMVLEYEFSGMTLHMRMVYYMIKLKCQLLFYLSSKDARPMFLDTLSLLKCLHPAEEQLPVFLSKLSGHVSKASTSEGPERERELRTTAANLQELLKTHSQTLFPEQLFRVERDAESSGLKRIEVEVVEPTSSDDDLPLKFKADLVTAVRLLLTLTDDPRPDLLRIKVTYPDGKTTFCRPRDSELKELAPGNWRLRTKVLLSDSQWSDSGEVLITLVTMLEPEDRMEGLTHIECGKPIKVRLLPKSKV